MIIFIVTPALAGELENTTNEYITIQKASSKT